MHKGDRQGERLEVGTLLDSAGQVMDFATPHTQHGLAV